MRKTIWEPAALAGSALLVTGVLTVFQACGPKEDGSWMHCHVVQTDVVYLSLVVLVIALIAWRLADRRAAALLHLICAALAIVTALLPGTILPMCMKTTMRCYSVMRPFVWIMGALLAVLHGLAAGTCLKKR